ncbi:MAG: CAP domain-containing protein [Acidimicrobiia bacterium]
MEQMVRSTRARLGTGLAVVAVLATVVAGCMPDDARTFLDRTNGLRASHGLPALAEHGQLTDKAEAWAHHMARTGRLAHSDLTTGLDGLAWSALGENVGMSTPTSDTLRTIHEKLASSPTHRANMLKARFTHMGVGVATGSDGRVWVAQVFADL